MKSTKYRKFVLNLCLVLLALTATLAIGEVFLRFVGYGAIEGLQNGREFILKESSNADIKYELVPGAKGYAWGTAVEINAHGHRGQISSPGKFNGFRIMAIGDSITFGNMLSVESTYPYQLSQLLNEHFSGYDVINFGVGGYDILQEVCLLEDRGLIYKPDLVVVGFCLNDIGVASQNLEYIELYRRYRSSLVFHLRTVQFVAARISRIFIGSWVKQKNQPGIFKKDYKSQIAVIGEEEHMLRELLQASPEGYPAVWYRDEYRIGRLRYSFERLSDLARKENFSVVVMIIPWLVGDSTNYPYEIPHKIVSLEAKRVGFDVLEVVDDFIAIGMNHLQTPNGDLVHPNGIGHRILADKLVEHIHVKWPKHKEKYSVAIGGNSAVTRDTRDLPAN